MIVANNNTFLQRKKTLNCCGQIVNLHPPIVMGILNITPDSFYDGNYYNTETKIIEQTQKMLEQGATIIDVGGYSSRPYAKDITATEEKERVEIALKAINKNLPKTIISLDTFRAEIAKWAVQEHGVAIINDISAGNLDEVMFKTIAELNVPYIMMHMHGNPQTMQTQTKYNNLINDICKFFAIKLQQLKLLGINDIIIDPGFGFGKTTDQNYQILQNIEQFKIFEMPIMVGLSRKSMIYNILNTNPQNALNGTTVLHTIALLKGANILRVHDVKQAIETIKLIQQIEVVS